jgi:hypothetical protein
MTRIAVTSFQLAMSSSLHAEYASDHEHVLGSILFMAKHEPDSPFSPGGYVGVDISVCA